MDINSLTLAQLNELNRRVVARIKQLRNVECARVVANLAVGEQVQWHSPKHGRNLSGRVESIGPKNVIVATEQFGRWRIQASMLTRVV